MPRLIELDYENLNKRGRKYFLGKKELVELKRASFECYTGSGIELWEREGQYRELQRACNNGEIPKDTSYYTVVSRVDISRGAPEEKIHVIFFKLKKSLDKKKRLIKKRRIKKG
jgi:hypothetical protein